MDLPGPAYLLGCGYIGVESGRSPWYPGAPEGRNDRPPPPFDAVLVDDTSRLARDTADAIRVVQQLTFCGVRIVFISQGLDTASEQAETLVAVHGVVDQLYIRELKHKTWRGIKGQLDRGFHTGSKTYGYRSVKVVDPSGRHNEDGPVVIGKRLEIDPEQATVIRHIYEWYLEGVSQPEMADRLNATDAPMPRGTPWTKNLIRRILTNERYLGKQIWGQTSYERRPGTNKLVPRTRPREQWHIVDHPELRIIDDELWDRAQARRETVRTSFNLTPRTGLARGRSGLYSKHLLVGLTQCGVCGKGFTITSGGCGSPRYGCPNSWQNGRDACDNRFTIMAKIADPVVLEGLQRQLLEPTMVKTITDAVTDGVRTALTAGPSTRKALEARRDVVTKKVTHLVQAIEHGIALPAVSEQLAKRQAELREIEEELAALVHAPDLNLAVIPTWVRQQLEDLSGLLADNPERAKAELQALNVRFTVLPIRDEGKPFLRVEGTGDLDALCGTRNLPSTARSKSPTPPFTTRDRFRPRSARGNEVITGAHLAPNRALIEY